MRIFYVVYIQDGILRDCVEAMRLLSDPIEKNAAHITVRGPYKRRVNPDRWNSQISGNTVTISSIANFFSNAQNTVYLSCKSPRLKSVWHKPDFGFVPHITLYDGKDSNFAKQLYGMLANYKFNLVFKADKLEPLISFKGQRGFGLKMNFNIQYISEILGEKLNLENISEISVQHRLILINKLSSYISDLPD